MTTTSPADFPASVLPSVWGSGVVRDPAGPGLLYHPRPTSIIEMLTGARRWLRTGDLGRINDEGYLFFEGRSKDIVIRGGENIACAHVEQALLAHPDVIEAAVLGLPHCDLDEDLAAVVTCRAGTSPAEDELKAFLRARLAHFEVPARWLITTDPLPTLAGEKVDKQSLKTRFLADNP